VKHQVVCRRIMIDDFDSHNDSYNGFIGIVDNDRDEVYGFCGSILWLFIGR